MADGVRVRAVATDSGLIVALSKNAINNIKFGGREEIDLVSGAGKMHVIFMRDTTFRDEERKLRKTAEGAAAVEKDIADLANDLAQ